MTASSMFESDGREPAVDVRLDLSAPQGWQVKSTSASSGTIPTGGQLRGSWLVTPPAGTLPGNYTLTASATYRWGGYNNDSRSAQIAITVPPAPPAGTGYLSDHYWLDASSGYSVALPDASIGGYPRSLQRPTNSQSIGGAPQSHFHYYLGEECTQLSPTAMHYGIVRQIISHRGTSVFS